MLRKHRGRVLTAPVVLAALLGVVAGGCSSSRTTDGRDGSVDRGASDSAPPTDAAADGAAPGDATPADAPPPDGPRPPPHWALTTGPAPVLEDHEAVLLADGRVLIVGGTRIPAGGGDRETLNAAWLYLPDKNSFVSAGTMNVAREAHTVTALADGRVLVTGGISPEDYEASTELFDPTQPADKAWTLGPPMPDSRWAHAAVRLTDGQVLVTGGFASSDSSTTAWLFDPQSDSWKGLAAVLKEARRGHATIVIKAQAGADAVLIVGGLQGSGGSWSSEYSNTLEVYDQANGTITLLATTMSKKRAYPRVGRLPDGRVLIASGYCGNNCDNDKELHDLYDPQLDTITGISHMGPYPYSGMALAMLHDGRALLISGEYDNRGRAVVFDFKAGGTWLALPDLLVPQSRATATVLQDGSVLVVGGVTSTDPYTFADQAERFYP